MSTQITQNLVCLILHLILCVSYLDYYSPVIGGGLAQTATLKVGAETTRAGTETAEPRVCKLLIISLNKDAILGEVTTNLRKNKLEEIT